MSKIKLTSKNFSTILIEDELGIDIRKIETLKQVKLSFDVGDFHFEELMEVEVIE